ncbi:MAG: hypothetical protein WBF83_01760 [Moheibacter sp.]
MKNLFFAFIAFVMMSGASFGQNLNKPTKEQVEIYLAESMEEFIRNLGIFYKDGQSYNQFKAELYKSKKASSTIPKEGEALLKKTYSYIVKGGATKAQIQKDGVKEMMDAATYIKNNGNDYLLFGVSNYNELADGGVSGKSPCKWYQLNCWFNLILGFDIWDIWCTLPFVNC